MFRFYNKKSYKVLLIPTLSVQRKLHGENQIAIPEDKHDSSPLQASYGDMMNYFEYQQGSQLSFTKNEHPPNTHAKMSKDV